MFQLLPRKNLLTSSPLSFERVSNYVYETFLVIIFQV